MVLPGRFGGSLQPAARLGFSACGLFPSVRRYVRPVGRCGLSLFTGFSSVSALVGFSGSRSLPASAGRSVPALVSSVLASGRGVAVGCAPGLDSLVRSACPSAEVFRVAGAGRGAFAARSVACVRAVAASGSGAGWVSFPGALCPRGLVPSSTQSACFCGLGSGSWASAALAAGLGVPLVVFGLPVNSLPSSWGSWVPAAASGPWSSGFRLVPGQEQLSLF